MRPLKIAHRGASEEFPDNTLAAFRRAAELGADMVECDVRLSGDGALIASHDADFVGADGVRRQLRRTGLREIQVRSAEVGAPIPTIEEVIDELLHRIGFYFELKEKEATDPLVQLIVRRGVSDRVIVGSFDPECSRRVKELEPGILTSVLIRTPEEPYVEIAKGVNADFVHLCWERYPEPHRLVPPALVDALRAEGLRVILWHEEREEVLRHLRELPVYALCGNRPELL